jgi:hypothetical protein
MLHHAGEAGVPAYKVHKAIPYAQQAAAWLREAGVAVIATRAGEDSRWWIAPIGSDLYAQSAQRVITDTYTAAVRKHQSMANTPGNRATKRMLKNHAVQAGSELGYTLTEIDADLKAVPMEGALSEFLSENGYLPT